MHGPKKNLEDKTNQKKKTRMNEIAGGAGGLRGGMQRAEEKNKEISPNSGLWHESQTVLGKVPY